MAQATFHSLRGEKSALILIQKNSLEFSKSPVYVPRAGIKDFAGKSAEELKKGDTFEIPDGFRLVDMIDPETEEPRTTKDGEHLKVLAY